MTHAPPGVQSSVLHSCLLLTSEVRGAQNAFMVKKDHGRIQFSKEPYNLTNLNSFKFSGICNTKAADIQGVENGIVLGLKSQKGKNSPVRSPHVPPCGHMP